MKRAKKLRRRIRRKGASVRGDRSMPRDRWAGEITIADAFGRLERMDTSRGDGRRYHAILRAVAELGEAIEDVPPDHVLGVVDVRPGAGFWIATPVSRSINPPGPVARALAIADAIRDARGLTAEDVITVVGIDRGASAMLIERDGLRCTAPGGLA